MSKSQKPIAAVLCCGALLSVASVFALLCVWVGRRDESAPTVALLGLGLGWALTLSLALTGRHQIRTAFTQMSSTPSWRPWVVGGFVGVSAFVIPLLPLALDSGAAQELDALHRDAIALASATLAAAGLVTALGYELSRGSAQSQPRCCRLCSHEVALFQTRCPECGSEDILVREG
jgi:hypothetical protein